MTGLAVRVEILDPRIRVRDGVGELIVEMTFFGQHSTVVALREGTDAQGRKITMETLEAALAGILIEMEDADAR